MKIGLFGDIHIRSKKVTGKYSRHLLEGVSVLNQIFELFVKEEVDTIIFLGDLFHRRYSINVAGLYAVSKILYSWEDKLSDVDMFALVGNHDIYKQEVNSIEFLSSAGWIVISKPEVFYKEERKMVFYPYTKNIDREFISQGGDLLLLHQLIAGFPLQTGITLSGLSSNATESETIDVSDIKQNYKWILSGHDHIPHRDGNVVSIGAPMIHSFGEEKDRGAWILDDGELTFHKMKYPDYITIEGNEVPDDNFNYYRMLASEDIIMDKDKENVQVVVRKEKESINRLELSEGWDLNEVLTKYVKMKEKDADYLDFGKKFLGMGE